MALLAMHGKRLPKPQRVVRSISGAEVRINATNQALQPHAGGVIRGWSKPIDGEIRYDQGIGIRNPDTGSFVHYSLAGAYDSNIALLLTDGENRRHNYERLAEILRRMELRGEDLQTNKPVHYGLINWFLGHGPMAEPDTRFMQSYLAGVGALGELARGVDLDLAFEALLARAPDTDARRVLAGKQTLLCRPIARLLADPHGLGGFLGRYDGELWSARDGEVSFAANPLACSRALYVYLHMETTRARRRRIRSGTTTARCSKPPRPSTPKWNGGAASASGRRCASSSATAWPRCRRATTGWPRATTRCGRPASRPTAATSWVSSCCYRFRASACARDSPRSASTTR